MPSSLSTRMTDLQAHIARLQVEWVDDDGANDVESRRINDQIVESQTALHVLMVALKSARSLASKPKSA